MDDMKKEVSSVPTPEEFTLGELATLPKGGLETLAVDGIDPIFEAQAQLINHAVQSMGMGKVRLLTVKACTLVDT